MILGSIPLLLNIMVAKNTATLDRVAVIVIFEIFYAFLTSATTGKFIIN